LRVSEIGGVRLAGLPGVFRPRVWVPRPHEGPPAFHTRAEFQTALRPGEAWRGGLPLGDRDTIFPEDFERLGAGRFEVLVAHESQSSHPHGYAAIDDLAAAAGVRLIVHGHHHQNYSATLSNGVRVRGLGIAETWVFEEE